MFNRKIVFNKHILINIAKTIVPPPRVMTYEKIKGKRMWRICLPSIGDKYLPVQTVFCSSKQNNNFLFLMGCSLCIKTNVNLKRMYLLIYAVHTFWLPTHRLMCRYITLNIMES